MPSYVVGIEDEDTMFVCLNSDWEDRRICKTAGEVYAAVDWTSNPSVLCASSVFEADQCTSTPWILKLCKQLGGAK